MHTHTDRQIHTGDRHLVVRSPYLRRSAVRVGLASPANIAMQVHLEFFDIFMVMFVVMALIIWRCAANAVRARSSLKVVRGAGRPMDRARAAQGRIYLGHS